MCFVAGTQVLAENQPKPIEQIKAGDLVWAADPQTGIRALKRVVRTFQNEANQLVHVQINGETIICTTEHPFYVHGEGWIAAKELKAHDRLVLMNGNTIYVEAVELENVTESIKVYNFEVADYHTYFVGEQGVLVHNRCWGAERRAYWKEQAQKGGDSTWYELSDKNLKLMKAGKAPVGYDGYKVVLHHVQGKAVDLYDYVEMSATAHIAFHKLHGYKGFGNIFVLY